MNHICFFSAFILLSFFLYPAPESAAQQLLPPHRTTNWNLIHKLAGDRFRKYKLIECDLKICNHDMYCDVELPASQYLSSRPSFFDESSTWPVFGPGTKTNNPIPAQMRFSIQNK